MEDIINQEVENLENASPEQLANKIAEILDNKKAKNIEPLEETIDDMVMILRDRHTKRLKSGACSIASGLVFMESLTYLERASDQCSSIAVSMLARTNDRIMEDHHDYLREIHLSNDVSYLAERERRREQYVKPLKEIQ